MFKHIIQTFFLSVLLVQVSHAQETYDLVLSGGRAIDPETGLDGIRYVGLLGGKIAKISETPLTGRETVDVSGMVVSPGFIDLHSHTPTPLGQSYQVRDGVTTALELEVGAFPVNNFGYHLQTGSRINYGASAAYGSMRSEVISGVRQTHIADPSEVIDPSKFRSGNRGNAFTKIASSDERDELRKLLHEGIDQGGIGIGLPLDYYSEGIDGDELATIFEVASLRSAPIFVHLRRGVNGDPAGLYEVLDLARESGASLHICHITHNAMVNLELFLKEIRLARADGVDVTTEVLPYTAGSTTIGAAVFGRDWRSIFNIDYDDVEWAATGERFNEAMFEEYRETQPAGQVIHHYLKEAWTQRAIVESDLIVVSDLLPMFTEESKVAPHNGTFAKTIGRYYREEGLLDLRTALAKMTLLPAQRLQSVAPAFKTKGRLQEGADADLTIFDPETIIDRATYQNPYQPSSGIAHVIVNGVFVVKDTQIIDDAYPGKRLRGLE